MAIEVLGMPGSPDNPSPKETKRTEASVAVRRDKRACALQFTLGEYTGRKLDLSVCIQSDHFAKIALAMMAVDQAAAAKAFGEALCVDDAGFRLRQIQEEELDAILRKD